MTDPRYKNGIFVGRTNQPDVPPQGDSPLRHGWKVVATYSDGNRLWELDHTRGQVKMRLYQAGTDPELENVDWLVFFNGNLQAGYAGGDYGKITASVRRDFNAGETK